MFRHIIPEREFNSIGVNFALHEQIAGEVLGWKNHLISNLDNNMQKSQATLSSPIKYTYKHMDSATF
jgi:hypothetical protein